jgi:hypothetical protein
VKPRRPAKKDYVGVGPTGGPEERAVCVYCFAAMGTVVGGVALSKAGGLAALKVALIAFASTFTLRRP